MKKSWTKSASTGVFLALSAVASGWLIFSCGGSSTTPPVGTMCVQNSECNNPLSCSFGSCHEACKETRDCPLGQRCVKDATGFNVCQLPTEQRCTYNSECKQPLVCASDFQCRNQCVMDVDCTKGQKCVESVCADPAEIDPITGKLKPGTPPIMSMVDAGVDGAAPSDGGSLGDTMMSVDTGVTTPVPVDAVTVDKPIVRQGELGIIVTVTAPSGLANAIEPTVGDCKATVQDGNTATSVTIRVSCPHGTVIGPKDLSFKTAAGLVSKAAVLSVSAITASPTGLDTNRGTSDQPYRTFKKAISVSAAGDTISLLDGTYDKDAGETFKDPIPSGVVVVGQSAEGTKLVGSSSVDGIIADSADANLTVKNLTISYFRYGVHITKPAKLSFENVKVTFSQNYGIYSQNADGVDISFAGDQSDISGSAQYSIYLYGKDAKFNWKGKGTISSAGTSNVYLNTAKANISIEGASLSPNDPSGTAFSAAGATSEYQIAFTGVTFVGQVSIDGKDKTVATLKDVTISKTKTYGSAALDWNGAKLSVSGASKFEGGGYSVQMQSGEAVFRNATFSNYYYAGVYVGTYAKFADLGNATQVGANVFKTDSPNASAVAINDARENTSKPITLSETAVNDLPLPAGSYIKAIANNWYAISSPTNMIVVY